MLLKISPISVQTGSYFAECIFSILLNVRKQLDFSLVWLIKIIFKEQNGFRRDRNKCLKHRNYCKKKVQNLKKNKEVKNVSQQGAKFSNWYQFRNMVTIFCHDIKWLFFFSTAPFWRVYHSEQTCIKDFTTVCPSWCILLGPAASGEQDQL